MSSLGMAGLVDVAVERHSKRARLESWVVQDSVGGFEGLLGVSLGSCCWCG